MAAAREFFCEYVFIDTPGALDGTLPLVAPAADAALIVTSHHPTTVRGAEKTGYQLEDLGVKEQYLIINRYDKKSVLEGTSPGLNCLYTATILWRYPRSCSSHEASLYVALRASYPMTA